MGALLSFGWWGGFLWFSGCIIRFLGRRFGTSNLNECFVGLLFGLGFFFFGRGGIRVFVAFAVNIQCESEIEMSSLLMIS